MVDALNRAKSRPGWLVPLRTASEVLVDERLYLEWGGSVVEGTEHGVKLYRIGRASKWYAWTGAGRWFEYLSDEGMAFAAACSEICWKREEDSWLEAAEAHVRAFAPTLLEHEGFVAAFATAVEDRRGDGESDWPRLRREAPRWALLGDVRRDADAGLVERLGEAGARAVDHSMIYPRYRSWARIDPGRALEMERDGATLRYVPHHRLGQVETETERVRVTWTPAALSQAGRHAFGQRSDVKLGTLVGERLPTAVPDTSPRLLEAPKSPLVHRSIGGGASAVSVASRIVAHLNERVVYELGVPWDDVRDDVEAALDRAARGERSSVSVSGITWDFRPAVRDDLGDDWVETPMGWWHLRTLIDRRLASVYRWCASASTFEVSYVRSPTEDANATLRRAVNLALGQSMSPGEARHADFHLVVPETLARCDTSRTVETGLQDELVTAPLSERGTLTGTGDVEALQGLLEDLGVARGLAEEPSWGRHQPIHPAYEDEPPRIPDGCMVLHGMTGVAVWGQALSRFERIVESGGLLAVSERRRRGFGSTTMSPLGDMASGVDWAVPCTVGTQPSYGKWIIFGLKPEVLARRDLWFSDRDFGGGKCRYDAYARYAESLGQRRIFETCPPDGRERHLGSVHSLRHNEVWLRWSVGWDEIDTVFVTESGGLEERVRRRVAEAQSAGLVPPHVRVESFVDELGEVRDEEVEHHRTLREAVVGRARRIGAASTPNPTLRALEARIDGSGALGGAAAKHEQLQELLSGLLDAGTVGKGPSGQ